MSKNINNKVSCMDDFDPNAILPEQALAKIFSTLTPITETESLPIRATLGRILATNIKSKINVPSGRNAAMDGYAVNASDLPATGIKALKLIGESFAGNPFNGKLRQGECVRIMTGAIMPEGSDTVIMQEKVSASADEIKIDRSTRPGNNVRQAGEDLAIDDLVLEKGAKITPADLGLLASIGVATIAVNRKLKVAFFSTGDELRSLGEPLETGMIYDSNRYTLYGMLSRLGVEILDLGVIKDDRPLVDAAFLKTKGKVDLLISSGGVSVGEADYVKETLIKHGEVSFWKVAIKPGRPLTFGKLDEKTYFFGLPGNPVSVMVTFYQFAQPALKRLAGENSTSPMMVTVPCISTLKKRPGRVEYQRGILTQDETNRLVVRKTGEQGSGILRSMADANCFIVLPFESSGVNPHDLVAVQPFYSLV